MLTWAPICATLLRRTSLAATRSLPMRSTAFHRLIGQPTSFVRTPTAITPIETSTLPPIPVVHISSISASTRATRRSLTIERGQLSAPDVTLARGCTTQRWQATPDPDSDHVLSTLNFVVGDDEPLTHHVPKPSYYSWGQANWQEYSRLVSEDCKRFPTKGTPNQQAKFLSRSIAKATAKAVPKGVTRVRHLWSADWMK